jgi:hypothetical protein
LTGPGARHDEIGLGPLGVQASDQVQRDDGVLADGPALQEQDAEFLGDAQQLAQIGQRLVVDPLELLAAVAHLHHRDAGAVPGEHFFGCLLEHLGRQRRGARGEVVDTFGHGALHHGGKGGILGIVHERKEKWLLGIAQAAIIT